MDAHVQTAHRHSEDNPQAHRLHRGHRRPHPGGQRPAAGRYLPDPRAGGQRGGRARPPPRRPASTSAAPRSWTPRPTPTWTSMVEKMVELRKGKMTADECRAALKKGNYFGTMLVKMGVADCLLGGATYSTADTVRPALQLIKTKPGNKIVSSCFILVREGVPAATTCWPWATAPSTSSPPRTSWWRSPWSAPTAPRSSASTPRWPC